MVAVVVAVIAALPATITALATLNRNKAIEEVRDALKAHATEDAAFQEWIVSHLSRDHRDDASRT